MRFTISRNITIDGDLYGLEALLRLHDSVEGMIPPNRFVPIAEESGLIVPIGNWILEEVCRQSTEWQRQGLPPIRIALNVSPLQFMRSDFSVQVRAVLAAFQMDPDLIEIEMTETTVMRKLDEIARQMLDLSEMGVHFSVDDFGTGYSSLRHLHQLPIKTLKIDRSFIERICDPNGTYAIVQAILSLAHSLEMQVVAEGVERQRPDRNSSRVEVRRHPGLPVGASAACPIHPGPHRFRRLRMHFSRQLWSSSREQRARQESVN